MDNIKKVEVINKLLAVKKDELRMGNDFISEALKKYVGDELHIQMIRWTNDVVESETYIEALELLLNTYGEEVENENIIDCPECEKEHDKDMSCLEAGAIRANV